MSVCQILYGIVEWKMYVRRVFCVPNAINQTIGTGNVLLVYQSKVSDFWRGRTLWPDNEGSPFRMLDIKRSFLWLL